MGIASAGSECTEGEKYSSSGTEDVLKRRGGILACREGYIGSYASHFETNLYLGFD